MTLASLAPFVLAAAAGLSPPAPATPEVRPLPGLWSMTVSVNAQPATVVKICMGAKVPAAWRQYFGDAANAAKPGCKPTRRVQAGQLIVHLSCRSDLGSVTLAQEMSAELSARRMHMVMTGVPTSHGAHPTAQPAQRLEQTGAYIGPCPPTMKEGQIQLANGRITDPLTMMREAQADAAKALEGLDGKAPKR